MIDEERALWAAARLPLERFLERVRTPWFLLSAPDEPAGAQLLTVGTIRLTREPATARLRRPTRVRLAPVRKRPGSNPFLLMVTLGRAPNNDIVLDQPGVSKFHAYLCATADGWRLSDARSLNGTLVDGVRLQPDERRLLRSGARVDLADDARLLFLEPAALHERLRAEARLAPGEAAP
jgi:hypothetical protein